MARKKTLEEVVEGFVTKHGDRYGYSKVGDDYVDNKKHVLVTCSTHGDFSITPSNHFQGSGCPKCADIEQGIKRTEKAKSEFVPKSNEIHNNKYTYLNVDYVNSKTHVLVTCPTHGDFSIRPVNHLQGQGCKKCADIAQSAKAKSEFIPKSNKIHNNKYTYLNADYVNAKKHVLVTCPTHGDFSIRPVNHLNDRGCPSCKSSKGETFINNYLESINIPYSAQHTFSGLVGDTKRKLRVDTVLPKYKIAIEFDGIQHTRPVDFSGKQSKVVTLGQFFKTVQYDNLKDDYFAQKQGWTLIRVTHDATHTHIPNQLIDAIETSFLDFH